MKRRVPYIPQMEMAECGAASLAMILGYWGHNAPLPQVREACKVSRDGANAANILLAARAFGLEAEAVRVEIDQMEEIPLPAILHWGFRHFVVIEKISSKGIHIVDPEVGRKFVLAAELRKSFTGVALVFEPAMNFVERKWRFPSIGRYKEILKNSWWNLLFILTASVLLQLLGLLFPIGNRLLVDQVLIPHNSNWLWPLVIGLILAMLVKILLGLLRSYILQGLQNYLDKHLMNGFVSHLVTLPFSFFLQRQTGDLIQRFESNAQIREFVSSRSLSAILDIFLLIGYSLLMVFYYWRLALIVILLTTPRIIFLLIMRHRNQQLMISELAAAGQENATLTEVLEGLETIKASASEERVMARWIHRLVRRYNNSLQREKITIIASQFMNVMQGIVSATLFWVGGHLVLSNRMSLGVFTTFVSIQILFSGPLESLLRAFTELQFFTTHLLRLDDVMENAPETSGNVDPGQLCGRIELEGVWFRYAEGARWSLQNLHFSIEPGEKVALVGRTGAGKSTLMRLLMGMQLPTKGMIRFDSRDLTTLDLQKLRSQMGVVMQETFLLDDTAYANIVMQNHSMPISRVRWAAKMADIDRVISDLPDGYNTRLRENASILSGGERQRLCLARAIALKPSLLLLDEATSSLDLQTESLVHGNLAKIGCTRIVIAHRIETVKDADRILVIDDGKIVQSGQFNDLCRQEGLFLEIVRAMGAGHG